MKEIKGVLPIVHTPFKNNNTIDYKILEKEIDWVFETGSHGYCSAMVSEFLRLEQYERLELNKQLAAMNNDRGVVVASVGTESIKESIKLAEAAEKNGCNAVMAIAPVATALPATAKAEYFKAIAQSIDIPLIIQDASGYLGSPLGIALQLEIFHEFGPDKIFFKPEANPIGPNISQLNECTNSEAKVFVGAGGVHLVESYKRGIAGTMPGCDILDIIAELWRALEIGDGERIYQLYLPVTAMMVQQAQSGLDSYLLIEKYLMEKRGIFVNQNMRQPFSLTMDEYTRKEVDKIFELMMKIL